MPSLCTTNVKNSETTERPPSANGSTNEEGCGIRSCITVVDKKVRNLEKRKSKLDDYKQRITQGQQLLKDQKDALEKYESVVQNLEFAHELHKQFQTMAVDAEKQQRKQARREKVQKRQENLSRVVEILKVQTIMSSLTESALIDLVKEDNLNLTADDITELKELMTLVAPVSLSDDRFEERLQSSAEHLLNYIEERDDSSSSDGKNYNKLKSIISKIISSKLLTKSTQSSPADEVPVLPSSTEYNMDKGSWADQVEAEVIVKTEVTEEVKTEVKDHPLKVDSSTATEGSFVTVNGADSTATIVPSVESVCPMNSSSTAAHVPTEITPATSNSPTSTIPPLQEPTHHYPHYPLIAADTQLAASAGSARGILSMHNEGYNQSFFSSSLAPPRSQRVKDVHEIVSAVQGGYDFLQDSIIDPTVNPNDDSSFPCVRTDADAGPISMLGEMPHSTTNHTVQSHVPYHMYVPGSYHHAENGSIHNGSTYFPNDYQAIPITTDYIAAGAYTMSSVVSNGFIPPVTSSHYPGQYYANGGVVQGPNALDLVASVGGDFNGKGFNGEMEPELKHGNGMTEEFHDDASQDGKLFTMNPNATEFKSKLSSPDGSETGDAVPSSTIDPEEPAPEHLEQEHTQQQSSNGEVTNGYNNHRGGGGNFGRYGPGRGFSRGRPYNHYNNRGRGGFQKYRNDNRQQDGFHDGPRNNFHRGGWNDGRRNGGGRGFARGHGDHDGEYRQNLTRSNEQQKQGEPQNASTTA